jgi:hypothetical protein
VVDKRHRRSKSGDGIEAASLVINLQEVPRLEAEKRAKRAVSANPSLLDTLAVWQFLPFSSVLRHAEEVEPRHASKAVTNWLRTFDGRLNPADRNDLKAPVDQLPHPIRRLLPPDCLALLSWPAFREDLNGRDVPTYVAAIRARVSINAHIAGDEIDDSVLSYDLDLALRIGTNAFVRGLAVTISTSADSGSISETTRSMLDRCWDEMSKASPEVLRSLGDALSRLDPDQLAVADIPAPVKVLGLWSVLQDDAVSIWPKLDTATRVYAVFRSAAEDVELNTSVLDEGHSLALVASLIRTAPPGDGSALTQSHRLVTDYVIALGWLSEETPELGPMLPACRVPEAGVTHCEGKVWDSDAYGRTTWCPRLRKVCTTEEGSHTVADVARPWWEWTLLELLKARRVSPALPESGIQPWPNAIGGWLNRWTDLRARLRCSTCHSLMNPDYRYSSRLQSAYGRTVMDCPSGSPGHDRDVYLNHCHGCHDVIDSRECPVRIDGFYLCPRCGSGPDTIETGSVCPKCGGLAMKPIDRRTVRCNDCEHRIKTPHSDLS